MFPLLRRRNFGLIWSGGLISLTGDWMLSTALPVYVYQLTGSTLATGAMLAVVVTPRLVFGSVAGVFVDRWDRRRTLIVANLLLALGLAPLLLVGPLGWLWLVYVVGFVESTIAQFVKPAEGALLPKLVGEDELVGANSLNALNTNVSRLLGPALGGLVVGAVGLAGVALLDALSFVVAAALTALTAVDARPLCPAGPVARPSPGGNPWATSVHQWLDGLRQVGRSRVLAILFGFMAISAIGEGVMGALFAPFTSAVLGGDALAYGWLVSAQAIGGIAGSLILSWRGTIASPSRLLGLGALGLSLIDLMTFNYHVFCLRRLWEGNVEALLIATGQNLKRLSGSAAGDADGGQTGLRRLLWRADNRRVH